MDYDTAATVDLRNLEPLVGAWSVEATWPNGQAWSGSGRTIFSWHLSGAYLLQQGSMDVPEAPTSVAIIGCDATNGTYTQLYTDDRGVFRTYQMSFRDREWRLWRDGEPFAQRFVGNLVDDDTKIKGRWERMDQRRYRTDFALTYHRVAGS